MSVVGDRCLTILQHTSKELIGIPDRVRKTVVVKKDRQCDATFAYQQIMVDVRREVLHYTSRSVYRLPVTPLSHTCASI